MWLGLGPSLVILAGACAAGAALATGFPGLARPFITRQAMEQAVRTGGAAAFVTNRMSRAPSRAGVLVFVSLLERMCWIVGDEAAETAIPAQALEGVRDEVVAAFRAPRPGPDLARAVARLGSLLAAALPAESANVNEVPNELILID
jgi:uncharacterized membrane protein